MAFQKHPATRNSSNCVPASSVLFSTGTTGVGPSPTNVYRNRQPPLWIDTDVGFDDLVAIGCCGGASTAAVPLHRESARNDTNDTPTPEAPQFSKTAGISTVGGGLTSDPSDGVAILNGLLTTPLQIVAGRNGNRRSNDASGQKHSSADDPAWLSKCREQMSQFCASENIVFRSNKETGCGRTDDDDNTTHADDEATAAIASMAIQRSLSNDPNTEKMDLVCLGPLTNLAHWLERIPDFAPNFLNSVWILGGNLPICPSSGTKNGANKESNQVGAETTEAEFNFARDPEAVRTVLHHPGLHGIPIYVVPQEVCNRNAFEGSFQHREDHRSLYKPHKELPRAGKEEFRSKVPSAASVIEDWLESSPPQAHSPSPADSRAPESPKTSSTTGDSGGDADAVDSTVASLLPTWMVRLIRTRTFSVYGDPICIYARDYMRDIDLNRSSSETSNSDSRRPRIQWKDYSTKRIPGNNNGIVTVDSDGRLIAQHFDGDETTNELSQCGDTPHHGGEDSGGTTIRIAHEVELGPNYLDWLARSLLSK